MNTESLRIISFNIQHLHQNLNKLEKFINNIIHRKPHIITLTEYDSNIPPSDLIYCLNKFDFSISDPHSNKRSIILLLKSITITARNSLQHLFTNNLSQLYADDITIKFNSTRFTIISVYFPCYNSPSDNPHSHIGKFEFTDDLLSNMQSIISNNPNTILIGDWNTSPLEECVAPNNSPSSNNSISPPQGSSREALLHQQLHQLGLTDIYFFPPNRKQQRSFTNVTAGIKRRLDRCYVTPPLIDKFRISILVGKYLKFCCDI